MAARKSKSKRPKRTAKRPGKKTKVAAKRKAAAPRWRHIKQRYASLKDLRLAIDEIDSAIVPLLCTRLGLVRTAAQFKPSHDGVVVQSRVEEIIRRVRALAEKLGANPDTMEAVYRTMIDQFTLEEQRNWRRLNATRD
ncbi:MAG: chorismate mutase [Hyphomicrobium sp.]